MLTEEQAGTIQEPNEHKLIIALPGSGKTFTFISLAEAILKMNDNHSVLLVTFTNAAAGEMKQRIEKRLGKQMARRTKSATFASLMMQQFKQISRGRKPVIGAEQYTFVKRALASLHMNTDEIEEWLTTIEQMGRDADEIQIIALAIRCSRLPIEKPLHREKSLSIVSMDRNVVLPSYVQRHRMAAEKWQK